jgi:hypothetical protein
MKDLRRLRVQQARSGVFTASTTLRERRSPLKGTLNGVFVRAGDIDRPVTEIPPVAGPVGTASDIGWAGSE